MSSKGGPRAVGTDGNDFKHRQRVASHYTWSVQYKSYLKYLFFFHVTVLVFMWTKVGGEFLVKTIGVEWPAFTRLDLPTAYPWEYVWSLSFLPMICALLSFPKNKIQLLKYHYYGQFVLGIVPCAIGIGSQLPELFDYVSDPENSQTPTFKGTFPMVIIWYIFFLIAFQIHAFAMYFSFNLMAAWQPPKKTE
uniref:Protein jagunal n=1 Tax=Steinernema glaseri TaxID=37863 RepID=A0A1I7YZE2_9BILA